MEDATEVTVPVPQAAWVFEIVPVTLKVAHPEVPPEPETIKAEVDAKLETSREVVVAFVVVEFPFISRLP